MLGWKLWALLSLGSIDGIGMLGCCTESLKPPLGYIGNALGLKLGNCSCCYCITWLFWYEKLDCSALKRGWNTGQSVEKVAVVIVVVLYKCTLKRKNYLALLIFVILIMENTDNFSLKYRLFLKQYFVNMTDHRPTTETIRQLTFKNNSYKKFAIWKIINVI